MLYIGKLSFPSLHAGSLSISPVICAHSLESLIPLSGVWQKEQTRHKQNGTMCRYDQTSRNSLFCRQYDNDPMLDLIMHPTSQPTIGITQLQKSKSTTGEKQIFLHLLLYCPRRRWHRYITRNQTLQLPWIQRTPSTTRNSLRSTSHLPLPLAILHRTLLSLPRRGRR